MSTTFKMADITDDDYGPYGVGVPDPSEVHRELDERNRQQQQQTERQENEEALVQHTTTAPGAQPAPLHRVAPDMYVEKKILEQIVLLRELGFDTSTSQSIMTIFALANTTEAIDSLDWMNQQEWDKVLAFVNSPAAYQASKRTAAFDADAAKGLMHAFATLDFPLDVRDERTQTLLGMLAQSGSATAGVAQSILSLADPSIMDSIIDAVQVEAYPEQFTYEDKEVPAQELFKVNRPYKYIFHTSGTGKPIKGREVVKDNTTGRKKTIVDELVVPKDKILPVDTVVGPSKGPAYDGPLDLNDENVANFTFMGPGSWGDEEGKIVKLQDENQIKQERELERNAPKEKPRPVNERSTIDEELARELATLDESEVNADPITMDDVLNMIDAEGLGDDSEPVETPTAPTAEPAQSPQAPEPPATEPASEDTDEPERKEMIEQVKPFPPSRPYSGARNKSFVLTEFADGYDDRSRKNRKPGDAGGIPGDVAVYDWGQPIPKLVMKQSQMEGNEPTEKIKAGTIVSSYSNGLEEAMVFGLTPSGKLAVRTINDGEYQEWDVMDREVRYGMTQAVRKAPVY